jgi:hypothetical protein
MAFSRRRLAERSYHRPHLGPEYQSPDSVAKHVHPPVVATAEASSAAQGQGRLFARRRFIVASTQYGMAVSFFIPSKLATSCSDPSSPRWSSPKGLDASDMASDIASETVANTGEPVANGRKPGSALIGTMLKGVSRIQ